MGNCASDQKPQMAGMGRATAPPGGDVLVEKFPMWVMKLAHTVSLAGLEPHETHRDARTITLLQADMLVSFISHQWIGLSMPDKSMSQFKEFQTVMKSIMARTQKVLV
mmetsp:Transcript_48123/g.112533  ORF Transcript_48123/g.112533 Transcript_48123/m.112533 type:complete len:108 (+) Transcript_48123:100-423(+)